MCSPNGGIRWPITECQQPPQGRPTSNPNDGPIHFGTVAGTKSESPTIEARFDKDLDAGSIYRVCVLHQGRSLCGERPIGRSAEPERRSRRRRYLLPATRRGKLAGRLWDASLGATSGELLAPVPPTLNVLTLWLI